MNENEKNNNLFKKSHKKYNYNSFGWQVNVNN